MVRTQFDIAYEIAKDAHKGQVDKAGVDYIKHPMRVAASVPSKYRVVAILHDVLEDSDYTERDLLDAGISIENVAAVKVLMKPHGMDYLEYVKGIKNNDLARIVKLSDLTHNMDISRISIPSEEDLKRVKKYRKAYEILINK